MPGKKRPTKSVSYNERDDDGDFVATVDNGKKIRSNKPIASPTDSKSSTRALPRKRGDKLTKSEQEELDLALKLSAEAVVIASSSSEIQVAINEKENWPNESTVSSHESEITPTESEDDEQDENSLPKSKRIKREEAEEVNDDDKESHHEEETKSMPRKEEPSKKPEISTITVSTLNSSRSVTRGQQNTTVSTSDISKTKSSAPIGFPTSKIVIPSSYASRVGLSRKSSTIKSLHPNLNQRIVHE